jgi:hypothetical protein
MSTGTVQRTHHPLIRCTADHGCQQLGLHLVAGDRQGYGRRCALIVLEMHLTTLANDGANARNMRPLHLRIAWVACGQHLGNRLG